MGGVHTGESGSRLNQATIEVVERRDEPRLGHDVDSVVGFWEEGV